MSGSWSVKMGKDGRWNVDYGTAALSTPILSTFETETLKYARTMLAVPQFTPVNEQTRTYTFASGKVTLEGVVDINVSKSGTHRINTKDGKKHIVAPGWMHIEFDAPHWSF